MVANNMLNIAIQPNSSMIDETSKNNHENNGNNDAYINSSHSGATITQFFLNIRKNQGSSITIWTVVKFEVINVRRGHFFLQHFQSTD